MDFTTLEINSIVIAPTHLHIQVREQILQHRRGILGLRILSLSQFLSSFYESDCPSMPRVLLQVQKEIKNQIKNITTYQNIVDTPLFLKECYTFLNDIRRWNINLSGLPQGSSAQIELYNILSLFECEKLPSDQIKTAIKHIRTQPFNHVYIMECYSRLEDQQIFDVLYEQGAHRLSFQTYTCEKQFYHAVNKRAEIEACAQYIIEHQLKGEDIHITLCDTTYQPIVNQIFNRYHIPFTFLQTQRLSFIPNRFLSLLKLCLHPDSEHVFACFDAGLFMHKGMHALREYCQVFQHDFFTPYTHVRSLQDAGNIIDTYTFTSLQTLEEKASILADELLPIIQQLCHATTTQERFAYIASIVKETLCTPTDTSIYKQVLALLEDVYPDINNDEDVAFLLPFIEDISIQESPTTIKGILIHSLSQDIVDKQHHFMLGATQSNYPAFAIKKGIFDEFYYAQITNYPSMQQRYQKHLEELEKQYYTSPYLYISYPLGTYEGKGMESALEIEQLMQKKSTTYPLHTNYVPIEKVDQIDATTARKLFVHDNVIHGSISAMERYVKCPFSYFLRYGLSLKEPMKPGFPDTYAGTLSHYILETLITSFGKDYAQHANTVITQTLDDEVGKLQHLFPSMEEALHNVKQRIEISMIQTIQSLEEFEEHSSLSPSKCEHEFLYDIFIDETTTLSMRGIIDRIDESREFTCILDYKSSIKTLSEANVFAALQLQLLTYAMVIAKEFDKEVLGAYYVSLKNESIDYPAGSISRRKPVTHNINDDAIMDNERKKVHRFNGWTFSDKIDMLDDDASHIVGIRMNKDEIIVPRKLYDLPEITKHITSIYQMIIKRLLSGDIACKPLEDACTYCVYHEICRFHGYFEEKKPWVEVGKEIYQNKEREDD